MTNDLQNPTHKKPLLGLNLQELKELATGLGLPAFVGRQLAEWLLQKASV